MKKVIAWPIAEGLYWLGHLVSRPMYRWDSFAWLYPAYNNLMLWSLRVNDWGGLDIWLPAEHD